MKRGSNNNKEWQREKNKNMNHKNAFNEFHKNRNKNDLKSQVPFV